jgi:hypothetical protein
VGEDQNSLGLGLTGTTLLGAVGGVGAGIGFCLSSTKAATVSCI